MNNSAGFTADATARFEKSTAKSKSTVQVNNRTLHGSPFISHAIGVNASARPAVLRWLGRGCCSALLHPLLGRLITARIEDIYNGTSQGRCLCFFMRCLLPRRYLFRQDPWFIFPTQPLKDGVKQSETPIIKILTQGHSG